MRKTKKKSGLVFESDGETRLEKKKTESNQQRSRFVDELLVGRGGR